MTQDITHNLLLDIMYVDMSEILPRQITLLAFDWNINRGQSVSTVLISVLVELLYAGVSDTHR